MKYFPLSVFIGLVVLAGSYFARTEGWYAEYELTDVILHILSGIMFGFLWLSISRQIPFYSSWEIFLTVAMAGVFGSFFWEVWELYGWMLRPDKTQYYIPELADSLSDMASGLMGAIITPLFPGQNLTIRRTR